MMDKTCYYIHALSALHVGTGQGTGIIDLPIAREKATGLPIVPGSGIKGVLREQLEPATTAGVNVPDEKSEDYLQWETLFGPSTSAASNNAGFAGALAIQDAHLLCLPVRSIYGVFAWVTCPFILSRYLRDLEHLAQSSLPQLDISPDSNEALLTTANELKSGEGQVFLEDLDFQVNDSSTTIDSLAQYIGASVFPEDETWQELFTKRFLIVSDEALSFLSDTATEIRARIKLTPGTRSVKKGGLWYEENLPAESILWGLLACDRSRHGSYPKSAVELMQNFTCNLLPGPESRLQLGGNATVGRGSVRYLLESSVPEDEGVSI